MRKLILLLSLITCVTSVDAEEYQYLSFQESNGNVVSFGIESLTMSISNGKLLVENSDESRTFELCSLSKMFFATDASGINELETVANGGKKQVYTVSGVYVGSFDSLSDVGTKLGKGMYLVKDNNNTTKIVLR